MCRIVVGYDGSEASRRALARVAGIADSDDSVTVVSAVPVRLPVKGQTKPYTPWEVEEHGRQLEEAKAIHSARGIEVETAEGVGDAADFIVAQAKEVGAS
jgi:hypothetical protein